MLKRILSIVVVTVMMLSLSVSLVTADTITAQNTADRNVLFSNGYRGYCLNVHKTGAYSGDQFNVANDRTAGAVNVASGADVIEFMLAGATAVSVGAMNFVNPYTTVECVSGIED